VSHRERVRKAVGRYLVSSKLFEYFATFKNSRQRAWNTRICAVQYIFRLSEGGIMRVIDKAF
jgi:hypothetical protein